MAYRKHAVYLYELNRYHREKNKSKEIEVNETIQLPEIPGRKEDKKVDVEPVIEVQVIKRVIDPDKEDWEKNLKLPRKQIKILNIVSAITLIGVFIYCFVSYYKGKYDDR